MRRRRAFTVLELSAVVLTVGVLAAILFPIFSRARERARTTVCRTNLFNMGVALRLYAADWAGQLPPGLAGPQVLVDMGLLPEYTMHCPSTAEGPAFPTGARGRAKQTTPPPVPPPLPPPGAPPQSGPAGQPIPPLQPPRQTPSYIYLPGALNPPSHRLLIADAEARHDDHANALFVDGSLVSLPEHEWYSLIPPEVIRAAGIRSQGPRGQGR